MWAFHSFWSKPNRVKNYDAIKFADYEMLTMILSALRWQETNGPIKLVTDTPGAKFFQECGLENLWTEIVTCLDSISPQIDPFLFWAAGKLYALKHMACPCVMLDTDLVIWKRLDWLQDFDIVAAHSEELWPSVYPDVETFQMKDGYEFPREWDYTLPASNTAFLYIKDSSFRDYYVSCAEQFMDGIAGKGFDPVTAMCYAEQRVLSMCAVARGQKMSYLLNLEQAEQQDFVTHIWGQKKVFATHYRERRAFCLKCIRRIVTDYPEYEQMLANCGPLKRYYVDYMHNM